MFSPTATFTPSSGVPSRAVDPLGVVLDDLVRPLSHPAARGEYQGTPQAEPRAPDGTRASSDRSSIAAVRERVDGFGELLQNIMSVNSALIDQAQNEAMKKVSSWGGILVVPTLISSVYGMNIPPSTGFDWAFNWPLTLLLMALSSLTLYLVFRRNGWL